MSNFENRVAIVTGGGNGLGRSHALALAKRGAAVVVADLSGANSVAAEIVAGGGKALDVTASVTDREAVSAMVASAMSAFGRVDILVNNAGVLRDKSFGKMEYDDFLTVMNVHVMGAFNCTKAVWEIMRAQNYGRIIMTTSSSGLFGSFGQANYSAAKMALVGLSNTLAMEGAKYDIRVNALAPTATTAMTESALPPEAAAILQPGTIAAGLLYLASENAPTQTILCAGGGSFERSYVTLTRGTFLAENERTPEMVETCYSKISDRTGEIVPSAGREQAMLELGNAGGALTL